MIYWDLNDHKCKHWVYWVGLQWEVPVILATMKRCPTKLCWLFHKPQGNIAIAWSRNHLSDPAAPDFSVTPTQKRARTVKLIQKKTGSIQVLRSLLGITIVYYCYRQVALCKKKRCIGHVDMMWSGSMMILKPLGMVTPHRSSARNLEDLGAKWGSPINYVPRWISRWLIMFPVGYQDVAQWVFGCFWHPPGWFTKTISGETGDGFGEKPRGW